MGHIHDPIDRHSRTPSNRATSNKNSISIMSGEMNSDNTRESVDHHDSNLSRNTLPQPLSDDEDPRPISFPDSRPQKFSRSKRQNTDVEVTIPRRGTWSSVHSSAIINWAQTTPICNFNIFPINQKQRAQTVGSYQRGQNVQSQVISIKTLLMKIHYLSGLFRRTTVRTKENICRRRTNIFAMLAKPANGWKISYPHHCPLYFSSKRIC